MAPAKRPDRETGSASRAFLRYVEEHGITLRHRACVGSDERLDPFATAQKFGIIVFNFQDLQRLDPDDIQRLKEINARTWSGGAQQLPDGRLLIVLNPNQTPERAAITVMEEVAHAHFGHRPSLLEAKSIGLIGRTYNEVDEEEAYWTGAAALLPSSVVAKAVWHATPADVLASTYGVSLELVEFRIKTLGLWPWYSRHRTAAWLPKRFQISPTWGSGPSRFLLTGARLALVRAVRVFDRFGRAPMFQLIALNESWLS